ncbi:MAG: pyruvate ferredoxin oxidoreductase [Candidatus Altiarchaeales archaeon]|nr:MAG: pyruvate ferredoxin oxidoreductase [Candidatus Altiarchaeales archaeon]RLI95020.1 MAG: pyruvate ferredoxin oxidoreductase [Candidatus Altiarchaeales archaeon]HDO82376.1 pyruvate ferredoxin oxidoreductase subunit gamma [Candidatus Altiarchaeales archaeon]HEX55025.1 pyruvate ferredoxin oxidoreductase subunit gamma [Candidatus Altiarchaeales archaeon]
MIEVRFHGRGGQGAVTAASLLAVAAFKDGKFSQAFPAFGVERRGAPVLAFTRIGNKFIRRKCEIYEPDILVVLDSTLFNVVDVTAGLKDNGTVIINTEKRPDEFGIENANVYTIDATSLAFEVLGMNIVNTGMLGAFAAFTNEVNKDSINEAIRGHFPENIAEKNVLLVNKIYEKARKNDKFREY